MSYKRKYKNPEIQKLIDTEEAEDKEARAVPIIRGQSKNTAPVGTKTMSK